MGVWHRQNDGGEHIREKAVQVAPGGEGCACVQQALGAIWEVSGDCTLRLGIR